MEAKKISFGFTKSSKKPNLLPAKENTDAGKKVELIKYVEGQEIKLVKEKPEEKPLVIPLQESHKTSTALASLMKRRSVLLGEEEPEYSNDNTDDPPISLNNEGHEDIEKRAARELLAEVRKKDTTDPGNNLILPIVKPEDLPLDGAKESTLDDYETIPIKDFGKAMLRGMGWTEPSPKTDRKGVPPIEETPMVRPKGMGLGADKALKKKPLLVPPEANEVLAIKRNAYVLILGGKHKDLYGEIKGFDDHAGRVIVQMAIGGAKETFNEFLCQPVSRKEYAQYGKCINNSKYEEYKKKENRYDTIKLDKDKKEFIDKSEVKKHDFSQGKYQENNGDYERNRKKHDYIEDRKDIKRESGSYREISNSSKEREYRHARDKYDNKSCSKAVESEDIQETFTHNYKDRRNKDNRDDAVRDYKRKSESRDGKEYHRNEDSYRQLERKKYESKSNNPSTKTFKSDDDNYKNSRARECEKSSNKERDLQRERKKEIYAECSQKTQYKTVELDDSSDFEKNSSKHKKSKKSALKKSKKSKKKYRRNSSDTSDTLSSSTESSSDCEEEKYKKHKKKTKKSKKQRERSRSRGRRY